MASPRPVPPGRRRGCGRRRPGRSARTRGRRRPAPCPAPRRRPAARARRGRRRPRRRSRSPGRPAGCGSARWSPGCRRPGAAGPRRRCTTGTSVSDSSRCRAIGRSGWTARASCTASPAISARSTGARVSGRCWSSRASSSRSSTSRPIRAPSASIRCISRRDVLVGAHGALPVQLGEAADRGQRRAQLVAGVGDEAAHPVLGAAGLLLGGLLRAEGALDPGSIPLSAVDSRPTSVRSSPAGTRWERSPAAMACAVRSTSASGRRLLRTSR